MNAKSNPAVLIVKKGACAQAQIPFLTYKPKVMKDMNNEQLQLAIDAAWYKTVYRDGAYYKCPGVHNYQELHTTATTWFFRKLEDGLPEEAADIYRRRVNKAEDENERRVVEWAYMDAAALFINTIMGVKVEGSYIEEDSSVPLPEKQVA